MKVLTLVITFLSGISSIYAQTGDSVLPAKKIAPWFVERFKLTAGGFYVVNKTNIQVGVTGMNGTDIDFEKDLGINREVGTFLADFQWRISRRSRITLNYYNIKRSSNHILDKDIVFNGNTFQINTSVNSFFNTAIYQFSYGYAILEKPTYEAGLFIGTHILGTNAGITVNGANAGTATNNDFGFTAPLPDLGVWGDYAISKRFAINMDVSYFALTLNDKTGRLLGFNFTFIYKLVKQLDLSLGYTGLDFKVDVNKKDATGNFKWGYNGPALAVNFSFGKKSWTHPHE
jgi:hypothetical protein